MHFLAFGFLGGGTESTEGESLQNKGSFEKQHLMIVLLCLNIRVRNEQNRKQKINRPCRRPPHVQPLRSHGILWIRIELVSEATYERLHEMIKPWDRASG